jgi:hypothetical protein
MLWRRTSRSSRALPRSLNGLTLDSSRGPDRVMSDPKQFWIQTRAALVARVLLASIVAASFLITLAPLGSASSDETGLMACCAGKAGHEGGSCSSGLLASSTEPQSEESDDAEETSASILVEAGGGIHAQSDEESVARETPETEHSSVAAISRNCAGECGACSTNFNRQPRPREQSALATKARPNLQASSQIRCAETLHVNTLQRVTTQLRPRAPPALSV